MVDQTPNHDLDVDYEEGEGWDYNDEFQTIEERLVVRDVESNLSNYTPHEAATFIATDTGAVYDGDGGDWNAASREFESVSTDSATHNTTYTDPGGRTHTDKLPLRNALEIRPGDDWQAVIDQAADGDIRRSSTVIAAPDPTTNDFFDLSNTSLPIVVEPGVTLFVVGWINYSNAVSDAMFRVRPTANVHAPGLRIDATGGGSGDIVRFDANGEADTSTSIATSDGTGLTGYPRIQTAGETPVAFEQTAGGSVAGAFAEIVAWNSTGAIRMASTGAGGFVNANRVRLRGSIESGDVASFVGAETARLNAIDVKQLNILSGVNHVGLWDGSGVSRNVFRGIWFDESEASTPYEWTSGTGANNKALRRNTTIASGTNNSGDASNEAIADMTL